MISKKKYIIFFSSIILILTLSNSIGQNYNAPDKEEIEIIHLDSTINSRFSDFGAYKLKDSLLFFTSVRPDANEQIKSFFPINYISQIYFSKKSHGKWSKPRTWENLNIKGTENANICFSPDKNKFYFTRIESRRKIGNISAIYVCVKKKGIWQKPQKLSNKINREGYSSTQPATAKLPDGNEILYFSSDMPGGSGKMDIWYTIFQPFSGYSDPINLGPPINSYDNEISPFYHQSTSTLYFSSDAHKTSSGYDVFRSKGFKNSWGKLSVLPYPINTTYNEMCFFVNESDTNGYLTSNRQGSYFLKNDSCCFDIYEYRYKVKEKLPELAKENNDEIIFKDTEVSEFETDNFSKEIAEEIKENNDISIEKQIRQLTPLNLYFDNDQPEKSSENVFTNINYLHLLRSYENEKKNYKKYYTKSLPEPETKKAEKEIEEFFRNKIEKSEDELLKMTEEILKLLQAGCNITLEVGGYCSPLYTSEYNYNLSQRRISSFIVFICNYRNGILIKHFHPKVNNIGTLRFILKPEGKEKAPENISDNPDDKRNSVYSPAASDERKLIIIPKTDCTK